MKIWPNNVPADLRRTLDGTLSHYGVEPPDHCLLESPAAKATAFVGWQALGGHWVLQSQLRQ
jgi:hypothetical protein